MVSASWGSPDHLHYAAGVRSLAHLEALLVERDEGVWFLESLGIHADDGSRATQTKRPGRGEHFLTLGLSTST